MRVLIKFYISSAIMASQTLCFATELMNAYALTPLHGYEVLADCATPFPVRVAARLMEKSFEMRIIFPLQATSSTLFDGRVLTKLAGGFEATGQGVLFNATSQGSQTVTYSGLFLELQNEESRGRISGLPIVGSLEDCKFNHFEKYIEHLSQAN